MKYLIVGLGNIGPEYHETRHNIGFMAVDALAKAAGATFTDGRYGFTTTLSVKGRQLLLLKPSTFMNLSGEAVKLAGGFYKIPPDHVLVISDDVSLPLGKLRIRAGGSAGGHNGLKNIIAHLGTDQFPRVKVGVGAPAHPDHEMVDWVIGNFSSAERKVVEDAVSRAVDAALCVMERGVAEAQNRYN